MTHELKFYLLCLILNKEGCFSLRESLVVRSTAPGVTLQGLGKVSRKLSQFGALVLVGSWKKWHPLAPELHMLPFLVLQRHAGDSGSRESGLQPRNLVVPSPWLPPPSPVPSPGGVASDERRLRERSNARESPARSSRRIADEVCLAWGSTGELCFSSRLQICTPLQISARVLAI